jgi:uncharacterized protein Yka (UPF0111/DUF47 family)
MKRYKPFKFEEMAWKEFSLTEWRTTYRKIFKSYIAKYKKIYSKCLQVLSNKDNEDRIREYLKNEFILLFKKEYEIHISGFNSWVNFKDEDLKNLNEYFFFIMKTELYSYGILEKMLPKLSDNLEGRKSLNELAEYVDILEDNIYSQNTGLNKYNRLDNFERSLQNELKGVTALDSYYNKIDKIIQELLDKKVLSTSEEPEKPFIYKGVKFLFRQSIDISEQEKQLIPDIEKVLFKFLDILEKHKLLHHLEKKCDKIIIGDREALKSTMHTTRQSGLWYAYYSPKEHNIYIPITNPDPFFAEAFFHEIGHYFFDYIRNETPNGLKVNMDWWASFKIWKRAKKSNVLPSAYAYTSEHEAFAEIFTLVYSPKIVKVKPIVSDHIMKQFKDYMNLL